MNLWIGGFLIIILVVFIVPWYVKQLGRFFCNGILEHLKEQTQVTQTQLTLKGEKDGKKEQVKTGSFNGFWKQGIPQRTQTW